MTTMMSALKCHHTTAWDDDVDGDGDIKDDVSSEMSPHSGLRCWRCWWDDDDDVTTIMSPHGGRPHNVFFSQSFQCIHWLTMNSAQKKSSIYRVNVGEGCVGVLQCNTLCSVCVFVTVCVCVCVWFGCACVCFRLHVFAFFCKGIKADQNVLLCRPAHGNSSIVCRSKGAVFSSPSEVQSMLLYRDSIWCGTFTLPTKSNLKMTHFHLMYLVYRIDCCVSGDLVEIFLLCKYLIDSRALLTQRHFFPGMERTLGCPQPAKHAKGHWAQYIQLFVSSKRTCWSPKR